jgi:putative salt-induced outer membrane protein
MVNSRKKILFFAALFFACYASNGSAETPATSEPELPPRTCHGNADFGFILTSGNTDTQSLGLAGSLECKPGVWTYLAKAAFIRNESDNVLSAKSLDTLFRASRDLTSRLKGYGQFNYFQNEFAGIENRYAVEGGLSYLLFTSEEHSFQIDGGFGYTKEDRVPVPGVVDEDLSFATARVGESYKWKFSENAELGDDAGFTFNLSDGSDWRFGNLAYVAAKLTTIFALKFSYSVAYLNQPVPGFEKTDTITSAAFVAKF